MKKIIALIIALFFLSTLTVLAKDYSCKEVGESARGGEVKLDLTPSKALLANYWGDHRKDEGTIKSQKSNGDRIYKGFPGWVDDGVEGSGYLFVSAKLLRTGKGVAVLYNRYCEDSCTTRSAKLECVGR